MPECVVVEELPIERGCLIGSNLPTFIVMHDYGNKQGNHVPHRSEKQEEDRQRTKWQNCVKVLKALVNRVGHTDQSPCCEEVKQLCEEKDRSRSSHNPRLRLGILSDAPSVLRVEDPSFPKPIERRRRRSGSRRAHVNLGSSWRIVFIVSFSSRILVTMSRSVFSACSWSCFCFSFVSFSICGTAYENPSLSSILACRNVRSLCSAQVRLGLASFSFLPSTISVP